LMVLEAFTPAHGILILGGVTSLLIGSFTLFNIHNRAIGLSWVTIILVVGTMTALFVFVISKALLIQRKPPAIGKKALIGLRGTAKTSINPEGTVFVNGEYWKARSPQGRIAPGEDVTVVGMEGRTLLVRRTQESRSSNEAPHSTNMEKE